MSTTKNGDDHERFDGDVAAYVLDALEGTEVRQFEEHLEHCDRCQSELAPMRAAVEGLPAGAPVRGAPPDLKDRVMAAVRAEAPRQAPKKQARHWPIARPRLVASATAAAAAAAAAVAIVLVLGGGNSTRIYEGVVHAPGASASLRQSGSSTELRVSRVPPPPQGRIYEVWLKRGARAPQPAGTLFANGTGTVSVPGNLSGVQAMLVTSEPRPNGSRTPTRAPIIVVRLS